MTAFFLFFLILIFFFLAFLFVSRASQTHEGRVHHTEASWDLEASQAVITSDYQSVIKLSTRDF